MSVSKLDNRLIAFFDVLGFSKRLEEIGLAEMHEIYGTLIEAANSKVVNPDTREGSLEPTLKNFAVSKFVFDSIILVSEPLDESKFTTNFIGGAIHLMENFFVRKFPLRGCIGSGDALVDDELDMILSPIFSSLIDLEKNQDWSGRFLSQDTEDLVVGNLFGSGLSGGVSSGMSVLQYPVPFKDKSLKDTQRWCLNWVHFLDDPEIPNGLDRLISPKKEATQAFIDYVGGLENDALDLPPEADPLVRFKWSLSKSGARFKYCDTDGRGVDPSFPVTVEVRNLKDELQARVSDIRPGVEPTSPHLTIGIPWRG